MLDDKTRDSIVSFVKKEPRTIQEVAQHIGKTWVTAEAYVQQVKQKTGLVEVKAFRKGTQGALKLVYYNYAQTASSDDVREHLYSQIRAARFKHHFDFMEVFQFIQESKKKSFIEEYDDESISKIQEIIPLLRQAEQSVFIFSGNLSIVQVKEKKTAVIDVLEELLARKVHIKILCRVNVGSMQNIKKLSVLLQKYPEFIEIRHAYQPLRGFIIDNKIARFKDEEHPAAYKKDELVKDTRIFYDIFDADWIEWLQKVFWNIYRSSIDYNSRWKEIGRLTT
jgi:hypothetical protein